MSFWKKVKQTAIADRLVEEKLYELVHRELESGERRDGLWAKAFQNSQGDEQKANALYIGYRVQSIKDEAEITDLFAEKYAVESKKTQAKLNETQGRQVFYHVHLALIKLPKENVKVAVKINTREEECFVINVPQKIQRMPSFVINVEPLLLFHNRHQIC
jgi:hypothetical protein